MAISKLRDVDGAPVTAQHACQIIATCYNVSKEIRQRNNQKTRRTRRERQAEKNRKREGGPNQARGESETPSI